MTHICPNAPGHHPFIAIVSRLNEPVLTDHIGFLQTNSSVIWINTQSSLHENLLENATGKMSAIL